MLDLRQGHGKRLGSVDVVVDWVDLESSRYGLRKVIFDDSLPLGKYIIRRGHLGCGIEELKVRVCGQGLSGVTKRGASDKRSR